METAIPWLEKKGRKMLKSGVGLEKKDLISNQVRNIKSQNTLTLRSYLRKSVARIFCVWISKKQKTIEKERQE